MSSGSSAPRSFRGGPGELQRWKPPALPEVPRSLPGRCRPGLPRRHPGKPTSREMLERIVEIQKPAAFQVSLEGLETHNDRIRGRGTFRAGHGIPRSAQGIRHLLHGHADAHARQHRPGPAAGRNPAKPRRPLPPSTGSRGRVRVLPLPSRAGRLHRLSRRIPGGGREQPRSGPQGQSPEHPFSTLKATGFSAAARDTAAEPPSISSRFSPTGRSTPGAAPPPSETSANQALPRSMTPLRPAATAPARRPAWAARSGPSAGGALHRPTASVWTS